MTHDGRALRILVLIDEYTRECLALRVAQRLGSLQVIEMLADVMLVRGIPFTVSFRQACTLRHFGTRPPRIVQEQVESTMGSLWVAADACRSGSRI